MIYIILAIITGWILTIFGLDSVVITGMSEVFDKDITTTGYFFLFALLGALKSVTSSIRFQFASIKNAVKKKAEAK